VPEQDPRGTAAAGVDRLAHSDEVVHQRVPAVRAEVPELGRIAHAASVPTMIVGVDLEAGGAERRREPGVSTGVLAEAVGDLHNGANRAARRPVPYEQLDVAAPGNVEGLFGHASKARAPTARAPSLPSARPRPGRRMASSPR